jgi:hypothetical protein
MVDFGISSAEPLSSVTSSCFIYKGPQPGNSSSEQHPEV